MTAGIVLNRGRTLAGGAQDNMAGDVYCGGCQQQLRMGHRQGCPMIAQEIVLMQGKEGESRCMDCGRAESRGHDADCSEVIGRFGLQLGGW